MIFYFLSIETLLNNFSASRNRSRGEFQLAKYNTIMKVEGAFEIKQFPDSTLRLCWKGSMDEVVLEIQGFLAHHSLPPLQPGYKYVVTSIFQFCCIFLLFS
jgi:hypothetical protein